MTTKRLWLGGAIALIIILLLIFAPTQTKSQAGSSYNNAPDGYSAWYDWLATENISVKRWQRPLTDFPSDATLIQVYPQLIEYIPTDWVKKGNTLVILGYAKPATGANFSTVHSTPQGPVKIDTRRRLRQPSKQVLLGDDYGAIAWEESLDQGKIIYVTTPYLAANAYQDYLPNYKFLAQLITQTDQPIWLDEYIHGYQDCDSTNQDSDSTNQYCDLTNQEGENSLTGYLAATWLFPVLIQLIIISLLAIWGGFLPFGIPGSLTKTKPNNTLTYIQALATVLAKADKTEYIVQVIGKNKQKQLQKALGLGESPLDETSLIDVWLKQTQKSPLSLKQWLATTSSQKRLTQTELLTWLTQGQKILRDLDNHVD